MFKQRCGEDVERNIGDDGESDAVLDVVFTKFGAAEDYKDGDFVWVDIGVDVEWDVIVEVVNDMVEEVKVDVSLAIVAGEKILIEKDRENEKRKKEKEKNK